jgi:hypothetical protein
MKRSTVVLCAITSALMLAGGAAAGHTPVPAPGTTVSPNSLSGGRAALVTPVNGGTVLVSPYSVSAGR